MKIGVVTFISGHKHRNLTSIFVIDYKLQVCIFNLRTQLLDGATLKTINSQIKLNDPL